MSQSLRRFAGGMILAVAALLFVVFTASINAAQSMGGPMNMSPSSEAWFFIVLVLDALFLLAAFVGVKLLRLSRTLAGIVSLLAGAIVLAFGIRNHINAPPLEGVNNMNMMPVQPFLHYVVYGFAGICLIGGGWLITNGLARKEIR